MYQIPITLLWITCLYQTHAQDVPGYMVTLPGYMVTKNKYCQGQNEGGFLWSTTLQECASACDDLAGCVSFEYFPDRPEPEGTVCQPSTTCTLDTASTQADFTSGPVYFYTPASVPGYTQTPGKYCQGQNEGGFLWSTTPQECASACDNLAGCVSFEYFPDRPEAEGTVCQPSTTCTLDTASTQADYTSGPVYFYTPGSGSRDCSVLAIDEFLLQCSSEFSTQTTAISDLDAQITQLESDLQNGITQNANDITQLKTDLQNGNAGTNTQISDLQQNIVDVYARLDLFAAESVSGIIDTSGSSGLVLSNISMKDLFIILLLVCNLVTICYIYGYKNKNRNEINKKHYSIHYDDESDGTDVEQ